MFFFAGFSPRLLFKAGLAESVYCFMAELADPVYGFMAGFRSVK